MTNAQVLTFVGRLEQGGALAGWIMMHEEEWTFRRKAGHAKSVVHEATVDWRIVVGEEEFTTSGHLSHAQAIALRDQRRFEMGDLSYDVKDVVNDAQRQEVLLKFVENSNRENYALQGDLTKFVRDIDSARLRFE